MDSTGARESPTAMTNDALTLALKRAGDLAGRAGEKWTASRARVYELLLSAGGPVRAYDLIRAYSDDRPAKPPTVYRALDFLEGMGLAHRIPSLSAYVASRGGLAPHVAVFLICRRCGSADAISPKVVGLVQRASAREGFRAGVATLEVHGVCRRCHEG